MLSRWRSVESPANYMYLLHSEPRYHVVIAGEPSTGLFERRRYLQAHHGDHKLWSLSFFYKHEESIRIVNRDGG